MSHSFSLCASHRHPLLSYSSGRNLWTTAAVKYCGHPKPSPAQGQRVAEPQLPRQCETQSALPCPEVKMMRHWQAASRLLWLLMLSSLSWCWNAGLLWRLPGGHSFCWVKTDPQTSPSSFQASQRLPGARFSPWHLCMDQLTDVENILTGLSMAAQGSRCGRERQKRALCEQWSYKLRLLVSFADSGLAPGALKRGTPALCL